MPRGKDAPPFGGSVETRGRHFNMIWFKFSFCDQMKSARPSIPPSSMFHEGGRGPIGLHFKRGIDSDDKNFQNNWEQGVSIAQPLLYPAHHQHLGLGLRRSRDEFQ